MLSIANFQRNASQNPNEVAPWSELPTSKSLQTASAGECAEKEKNTFDTVCSAASMENRMEVPLKKLKYATI